MYILVFQFYIQIAILSHKSHFASNLESTPKMKFVQCGCLLVVVLFIVMSVEGKFPKVGKFGKTFKSKAKSAEKVYKQWLQHPADLLLTTAGLAHSSYLFKQYLTEKIILVPAYKDMEPHLRVIKNMTETVGEKQETIRKKKETSKTVTIVFFILSLLLFIYNCRDLYRTFRRQ